MSEKAVSIMICYTYPKSKYRKGLDEIIFQNDGCRVLLRKNGLLLFNIAFELENVKLPILALETL